MNLLFDFEKYNAVVYSYFVDNIKIWLFFILIFWIFLWKYLEIDENRNQKLFVTMTMSFLLLVCIVSYNMPRMESSTEFLVKESNIEICLRGGSWVEECNKELTGSWFSPNGFDLYEIELEKWY